MRKLALTKDALKFVSGLDAKQYKQVMVKCLTLLEQPQPNDSIKMKGFAYYRTDIGEFRIVYLFDADLVSVDKIGKRNDDEVYK